MNKLYWLGIIFLITAFPLNVFGETSSDIVVGIKGTDLIRTGKEAVAPKKTGIETEEKNAEKEASGQELQAMPAGLIMLGSDKAIAMLLGCILIVIVLSAKMYFGKNKKYGFN